MAWPSRTSAVKRGSGIASRPRSSDPCSRAVRMVIATSNLRGGAFFLELLGLIVRGQGLEDLVEFALHHKIQLVERESDAVIGQAVLAKVISADFFAAVAGTDHGATFGADRRLLLFQLHIIEAGAENAHGLGAILDLRLFILAGNNQAGGKMRDAHR